MTHKQFGWASSLFLILCVILMVMAVLLHTKILAIASVLFAAAGMHLLAKRKPKTNEHFAPDERDISVRDQSAHQALFALIGLCVLIGAPLTYFTPDGLLRIVGLVLDFTIIEAVMLFVLFLCYQHEYRYRAKILPFILVAIVLAILPIAGGAWFVYQGCQEMLCSLPMLPW